MHPWRLHVYSLICNCFAMLAYGNYMRPAIILGTSRNSCMLRKVQFTLYMHPPANHHRGQIKEYHLVFGLIYARLPASGAELNTSKIFRMYDLRLCLIYQHCHGVVIHWRRSAHDSDYSPYIRSFSAPRHETKIPPTSSENPIIQSNE